MRSRLDERSIRTGPLDNEIFYCVPSGFCTDRHRAALDVLHRGGFFFLVCGTPKAGLRAVAETADLVQHFVVTRYVCLVDSQPRHRAPSLEIMKNLTRFLFGGFLEDLKFFFGA